MAGAASDQRPFLFVLAGVNGAGKSSVGGAMLAAHGLTWFNPDSYARELMQQSGLSQEEANDHAWRHGRERLEAAIAQRRNHAFETTLGANTIPRLLAEAAETHQVSVIFVGLSSPEEHIARVKQRVAAGGHDIPEAKIRERWKASQLNLIRLMPHLSHLQVFDNSVQVAPGEEIPDPVLVLEMIDGKVEFPDPADAVVLAATPQWAKAIVQAALEHSASAG
jgi:predicted ABC-type ATPase